MDDMLVFIANKKVETFWSQTSEQTFTTHYTLEKEGWGGTQNYPMETPHMENSWQISFKKPLHAHLDR